MILRYILDRLSSIHNSHNLLLTNSLTQHFHHFCQLAYSEYTRVSFALLSCYGSLTVYSFQGGPLSTSLFLLQLLYCMLLTILSLSLSSLCAIFDALLSRVYSALSFVRHHHHHHLLLTSHWTPSSVCDWAFFECSMCMRAYANCLNGKNVYLVKKKPKKIIYNSKWRWGTKKKEVSSSCWGAEWTFDNFKKGMEIPNFNLLTHYLIFFTKLYIYCLRFNGNKQQKRNYFR